MRARFNSLERAHSLIVAFNRHEMATIMAHFDSAATWNRGDGGSVQSRDMLAGQLREFFEAFPDAALTDAHCVPIGADTVVVEWTLCGTHLHDWRVADRHQPFHTTGRAIHLVGADVLRFSSAGLIIADHSRGDCAALLAQLSARRPVISATHIPGLAERYTAAWGSQKPERVATFYSEHGSLRINCGVSAVGRAAVTASAQSFMSAFPDMKVIMDDLQFEGDRAVYQWTLIGTNTGPGGSGKPIHLRGFELWQFDQDGLIAESRGHFDSAVYEHQLQYGLT
jgi:nuclear transport factor 2 (NTF2) superfamily protein